MPTTLAPEALAMPVALPLLAAAAGAIPLGLRATADRKGATAATALGALGWLPAVALAVGAVAAARLPDEATIAVGGATLVVGPLARAQATFGLGAGALVATLASTAGWGGATGVAGAVAGAAIVVAAVAGDLARVGAAGIHVAILVTAMAMAAGSGDAGSSRSGWRASTAYLTLASLGVFIVVAGLSLADVLRVSPGGLVTETFVVAVLAVGFALAIGLFPLHFWVPTSAQRSAPGAAALALGMVVPSTVGLLVQVLAALPHLGSAPLTARLLTVAGLLACGAGAVGAAAPGRLGRRVGYASLAGLGPVLLGLGTGTRIGVSGALVALAHHAACTVVLLAAAPAVEGRGRSDPAARGNDALVRGAFVLAALAASGVPPLGGFAARWEVMQALSLADWRLAMAAGASGLVTLASLLAVASRPAGDLVPGEVRGRLAPVVVAPPSGGSRMSAWLMIAIAASACAWGLAPSGVLGAAHRATAQVTYLRPF